MRHYTLLREFMALTVIRLEPNRGLKIVLSSKLFFKNWNFRFCCTTIWATFFLGTMGPSKIYTSCRDILFKVVPHADVLNCSLKLTSVIIL